MSVLFLVCRVVFVLLFLDAARVHLWRPAYVSGYNEPKGLSPSRLVIRISGAWLGVAGIMVALGVWGDLAAYSLALHMAVTTPFLHAYWRQTDTQERLLERTRFLKHYSIAASAVIIGAFFAWHGGPDLTLTGPLLPLD